MCTRRNEHSAATGTTCRFSIQSSRRRTHPHRLHRRIRQPRPEPTGLPRQLEHQQQHHDERSTSYTTHNRPLTFAPSRVLSTLTDCKPMLRTRSSRNPRVTRLQGALVDIPPQPEEIKPFLVSGAIVDGAFISIVRRRGEGSVPTTAQEMHSTLVAGRALLRRGHLPQDHP